MNFDVAHAEVHVPSARPADVRLFPFYRVQEEEARAFWTDKLRAGFARKNAGIPLELQLRCVDRSSFYFKSDYSKFISANKSKMIIFIAVSSISVNFFILGVRNRH